jgi:hypothetical protein
MADAASTLVIPSPLPPFENVGQHVECTRDIKWASTVANSTAGKTVTSAQVGVSKIISVAYVGDVGTLYAGTDTVHRINAVINAAGTSVVITGTLADGTALDLDDTDIAAARLVFRCVP